MATATATTTITKMMKRRRCRHAMRVIIHVPRSRVGRYHGCCGTIHATGCNTCERVQRSSRPLVAQAARTYLNGVVDELCHGVWYLAEISVAGLGDGVEVWLVRHLQLHVSLQPERQGDRQTLITRLTVSFWPVSVTLA